MRLANIFAKVNGVTKGQSAIGTSDVNCLDVKAYSGGVLRDITQVVSVDGNGMPTIISRRLTGTVTNEFKYVTGQLTCSNGNAFNNYSTSDTVQWGLELAFCVTSLASDVVLADNTIDSGTYWKVYVNTSGQICYGANFNGNDSPALATWTNWTVTVGKWYKLSMYGCVNGSYTMYASLLDYTSTSAHSYTSKKNIYRQSSKTTARNLIVGSANVRLRDSITVQGTTYSKGDTQNTLTVNVNNATAGSALNLTNGGRTLSGGLVSWQTKSTVAWMA